jgi:hypothetical protein
LWTKLHVKTLYSPDPYHHCLAQISGAALVFEAAWQRSDWPPASKLSPYLKKLLAASAFVKRRSSQKIKLLSGLIDLFALLASCPQAVSGSTGIRECVQELVRNVALQLVRSNLVHDDLLDQWNYNSNQSPDNWRQ